MQPNPGTIIEDATTRRVMVLRLGEVGNRHATSMYDEDAVVKPLRTLESSYSLTFAEGVG